MRTLRVLHRWLGLLIALPLLVQGLTGAILTLEPALPHWGTSLPGGPALPANAMLAAAQAAAPEGMRVSRFAPPEYQGGPAQVYLSTPGGPRGPGWVIQVDPATATPLGPAVPARGVMQVIRQLHENWLVPEWGGRQVSGWLGVGLLVLILLGIPLWWPAPGRWKDGFTVPRGARGVRLQRSLHGASGIWLWVMLFATSTTGIMQGFPQTTRAALGVAAGGPPRGGRGGPPAPAALPDLDGALRVALAAAPGTSLRMAMLPAGRGEPVRLFLGPPGTEGVITATQVAVEMSALRVASLQGPAQASWGETVLRWGHDLHFGQGFGPVWRGLTVAVGVALPLLGVTGGWMWLLRRRNRQRVDQMRKNAVMPGDRLV